MGSVPVGLQRHALWSMDGRTWIEPYQPSDLKRASFKRALDRGWMVIIPDDLLREFLSTIL